MNLLCEVFKHNNRQIKIIDLYSLTREKAFNGQSYYSSDTFHPSDEGYNFWSKNTQKETHHFH
jgi:lysophospholipase L1-like esterase